MLVNEDKVVQDTADSISIYVKSNGVHTDLVLPTNSPYVDWGQVFPYANTQSQVDDLPFVAIGWGDKGFYLNTPQWKDLKASTAFKAATGLGETALHVTYYSSVVANEKTKKIDISPNQYRQLIQEIQGSIAKDAFGQAKHIATNMEYGQHDAFYEANGAYSLFYTCNTWTNNILKHSGIKASRWLAFEKGVMLQNQEQ